MYECKINPWAEIDDLSDDNLIMLLNTSKKIMNNALEHHGTTLYTYTHSDKTKGEFQHQLKVYGKATDPEGNPVVTINTTPDGRTTHYVPNVQTIGNIRDSAFLSSAFLSKN